MSGGWYAAHGKRLLDLLQAGVGMLVLSPILLLTGVAVRLEDGGPALFRQERSGRDDRPFTLLKFRSMPVGTDQIPSATAATLQVTGVGRLIRRLNVDELPQLINIVRGEMSLVGPRPPLPSQASLLAQRAANGARACRPGLTGLAQINSYDGMPEAEKAAWDGRYAADISLAGDLAIMARTAGYLFRRPPAY